MRISDWSSDVCSSDLRRRIERHGSQLPAEPRMAMAVEGVDCQTDQRMAAQQQRRHRIARADLVDNIEHQRPRNRAAQHDAPARRNAEPQPANPKPAERRSAEQPSELPSLMRLSYAVFCLKKK